jgi:hypothetical protein
VVVLLAAVRGVVVLPEAADLGAVDLAAELLVGRGAADLPAGQAAVALAVPEVRAERVRAAAADAGAPWWILPMA